MDVPVAKFAIRFFVTIFANEWLVSRHRVTFCFLRRLHPPFHHIIISLLS